MINSTPFAERLQQALRPTSRGVIGLADDLLELCRTEQLQMLFRDDHCEVRPVGQTEQEPITIPLPKSVFRAVLARIAALCRQSSPETVSPYGGRAELTVPETEISSGRSSCWVEFTNSPTQQDLTIRFSQLAAEPPHPFTVLLRDQRTVKVAGHALKYLPLSSNPAASGSYGILSQVDGEEILVALFPVEEVTGVFRGEIIPPRGGAEPS